MHKCPVPGCERNVSTQYLMCRIHWFQVPPDLKRRVYATCEVFHGAPTNAKFEKSYKEACLDAIEHCAKKELGK
jgi:hypothetical protein